MASRSSHKPLRLQAQGLSFSYGQNRVFHRLGFVVETGTPLWVVGTNGSGKSTLLRMVAGLLEPHEGTLRWSPSTPKVGYSGTDPFGFFPQASVRENFGFFSEWGGQPLDQRRAEVLAEALGCAGWLDTVVQELSTGNKQRMALVRSLLANPDAVLWDEPLAHLDGGGEQRVLQLIETLNRQGVLVVIATPELPQALEGSVSPLLLKPASAVSNIATKSSSEQGLDQKTPPST